MQNFIGDDDQMGWDGSKTDMMLDMIVLMLSALAGKFPADPLDLDALVDTELEKGCFSLGDLPALASREFVVRLCWAGLGCAWENSPTLAAATLCRPRRPWRLSRWPCRSSAWWPSTCVSVARLGLRVESTRGQAGWLGSRVEPTSCDVLSPCLQLPSWWAT